LIKALEINNKCDIDYRAANNKRLHLEIALLKMCSLCSQALNMPTAQTQPVQMPRNRPAMQPTSQANTMGGIPPTPLKGEVASTSPSTQTAKVPEPVEGPTNKSTPPQPQPNNSTVQQPTIQPQAAPVSTGTTAAAPAQPVVRPRGTASSISINKAMQQAEKMVDEKEETWDSHFTQEQLTEAWADFVNRYKNVSPNFAAALGKYTPKLIGTSEIHFSVDNLLFEHDTEGMSALKHHLKQSLHNNQYQLKPEVMERPAEIEAYTDKDKFEKMVEERPYLRTLQTELKLEGDL
jgi:DNA polymerase-3 subunit gamma/tau